MPPSQLARQLQREGAAGANAGRLAVSLAGLVDVLEAVKDGGETAPGTCFSPPSAVLTV